jgi:hypothetical protein
VVNIPTHIIDTQDTAATEVLAAALLAPVGVSNILVRIPQLVPRHLALVARDKDPTAVIRTIGQQLPLCWLGYVP